MKCELLFIFCSFTVVTSGEIINTLYISELIVPEDVRASRSSPDEIVVAWQRPDVPPNLLIRYVVSYSSDPQLEVLEWSRVDPVEASTAVLADLDPDVTYYVRVRVQLDDNTFGPISDVAEVKSSLEGI